MPQSAFFQKVLDKLDKIEKKTLSSVFREFSIKERVILCLLENLDQGILILDSQLTLMYMNSKVQEMLGVGDSDMTGRSVEDVMNTIGLDHIGRMIKTNPGLVVIEEVEYTGDQHGVFQVKVFPVNDESFLGSIVMVTDAAEARAAEMSMIQHHRLSTYSLLAAGVAHEIGNPLNSLKLHLKLMEKTLQRMSDEQRKNLEHLTSVCLEETERFDHIISQFLRAIRPVKTQRVLASVNEIVSGVLEFLSYEMTEKGITIRKQLDTEMSQILIDPTQIKQAFFNIVSNAMEAMDEGGVLTVRTETAAGRVLIYFTDTGKGIPAEDAGKIFEPYFSTKKEGSGLGMMITYKIIAEHGGTVDVASEENVGTTITVKLPQRTEKIKYLPQKTI